ncbi:MAG: V-type ATP synthase subunit D [Candidatus Omnitrophica bacterium]|nr:V-type ATP synthase subunit D [Candidatus Omnitrophota bacterium]
MAKIKLTKGELKKQRDALHQYERYLPTLQLKKQQLQLEISRQALLLAEKKNSWSLKIKAAQAWSGLLTDESIDFSAWLAPRSLALGSRNIAGVEFPVFQQLEFPPAEYDLFITPLWVDAAIEALRALLSLEREIATIEKGIEVLRQELRVTTQRVNLFEKVKIPEAQEAIRLIKIYIGDQMANAVGRSKMAKKKIEENEMAGVI